MSTACVYGLRAADGAQFRYIGQTKQSLSKRLESHLYCDGPTRRRPLFKWIQSVLKRGSELVIVKLYEPAVWHETERDLIRIYREMGADLLNLSEGGGGKTGIRLTAGQKSVISFARKGMRFTDEHRANIAAARARQIIPRHTAEAKAKISAARRGRKV